VAQLQSSICALNSDAFPLTATEVKPDHRVSFTRLFFPELHTLVPRHFPYNT
jgi:hypothetical protein